MPFLFKNFSFIQKSCIHSKSFFIQKLYFYSTTFQYVYADLAGQSHDHTIPTKIKE